MKLFRTITMKAALIAAMAGPIFSQSAYGQQEMDPTWYNPWPDALKPAAKPKPTKIAENKDKAAHKDHAFATQAKKKEAHAREPLRTAEVLPPVKK